MSVSVSILLGVVLGVANAVAAVVLYGRARGRDQKTFFTLVLGGMLVRMGLMLAVIVAVLALGLVSPGAFVAALGVTFVAGLAVEIAVVMLRPDATGAGSRSAASSVSSP